MTIDPVEVDIGLTSLTFADMFETTIEIDIARNLRQQVDILYSVQAGEHVLLVNDDLFLTRCQIINGVAGTESRHFKCHLDGHFRIGRIDIAIRELRLILSQRIHVCHFYTEIVCTGQILNGIRYVQVLKRSAGRNNRILRFSNRVHTDCDFRLYVLQTEINLIGLYTHDHALRDGVEYRLTRSESVGTSGQTGRRAVE